MITEDYCNFETAKLLKEKRFEVPSFKPEEWLFCMYDEEGKLRWGSYSDNWYCRATLQMAMKWLREIHNIHIEVNLTFSENPENHPARYYVYVLDTKSGNSLIEKSATISGLNPLTDESGTPRDFNTYEEACEAAIKYCLENLI